MSAPLIAGRHYHKVAIKVLRPEPASRGVSLDAVIAAHAPLPVSIVRELLLQICAALQHAHDQGVIHGNLRPPNIFIDDRGGVRVDRFGGARRAECEDWARGGRTGIAPAADGAEYMSPEQCLGQPASVASDQYSVGLIAYELLSGVPPFIGHPVEVHWAHLREAPVWVSFARRDCPTPLAAMVMRMLAKEPNDRWASLRNAVSLIALLPATGPVNRRAALARLVRATQSAQPPSSRPRPVSALQVPPRQTVPAAESKSDCISTPALPGTVNASVGLGRKRLTMAIGIAVAIVSVAWFEAFTLARRPHGPSASIARPTSGPAGILHASASVTQIRR